MPYYAASGRSPRRRRGIILLVVLAMLTLFAIIGLTFVLYANAEAEAARISRDAESASAQTDVASPQLLDYFLRQLVYDAADDDEGIDSALRGHGLLRGMYGLDYDLDANGAVQLGNNSVAYNGTGRLHAASVFAADATAPAEAADDYNLVNYTYFPADAFLRDPERPGARTDPTASRPPFRGGFNAPYTYPDLNNMFLAAVKADGTVLLPSYHRPCAGFGPLDPGNPNWTDATKPWLKYQVLRPRPADNPPLNGRPGFPLPADAGGDVKNLPWAPGGNDSIWLDLGYPVTTGPDGRKFKPLFAPLIMDLDGRVNLNVHGNMVGAGGGHVSNQGWGPWEVGLNQVLRADATEWQNLLRGARDPASLPGAAAFGPQPHFYGRVDFDGRQGDGTPSGRLQLPAPAGGFPLYPAGYDNADPTEVAHHPSLAPANRFSPADFGALRRLDAGATGGSVLFALCPRNFADPRTRHLVTTYSFDPDCPGVVPWASLPGPFGQTARDTRYPATPERLEGGGSKPFPAAAGGEFTAEGRAADAGLGRVDVNRPLPDYPAPDAGGRITDLPGFLAAQSARQALAGDIYLRLVKSTGAYDPDAYRPSAPPTLTDIHTLRWLAQLAVNMVDFIDTDDYSTPFNWGRAAGTPDFIALYGDQWVFGTELPRVTVNEAYAEYVNLPGEVGEGLRATKYQVNVWVELVNPFRADPGLRDGGAARLPGAYQLVLTRPNKGLLGANDTDNVLGDPDNTGANQAYDPKQVHGAFSAFNPALLPVGGYYVVGPPNPVPGAAAWDPGPNFPADRTGGMTYRTPVKPGNVAPPSPPTVLLRRLACPALPYQPDPTLAPLAAPYNPYVTVDYLENVPLNKGASNTGAGFQDDPPPVETRYSIGRTQPYDGRHGQTFPQAPAAPRPGYPQQTLGAANLNAVIPTPPPPDWLVHLDRPLVSPVELLHVSCCKPHQLTHLFKDGTQDPYQSFNHAPYWLLRDGSSPLYRAFEFLETHGRVAGVNPGDRIPGKINLNTIWDPETFTALCDPQASNTFDAADVRQIYAWMLASRTPAGAPGAADRPFKGLASAAFVPSDSAYADGAGLSDTILRDNPSHPLYDAAARPIRLFEVVKKGLGPGGVIQDHPYQRYELLNKVFNQVTTRSNVFAVWVTVGFFEVNDDTTRPAKLGAEITDADGRPVRHHLFAIVDRSNPPRLFPAAGQPPLTSATPVPAPGPAEVAPTLMRGAADAYTWSIQPGTLLEVTGPDANGVPATEKVLVTATTATTFTAVFRRAYPKGFTLIVGYGNPGPGTSLVSPCHDPSLTPYREIID